THTETDTDTKYTYDAIYRLLQSMPVKIKHSGEEKEFEHKPEIFTYDPVGNRLTGLKDKLNYTYNIANQLTGLTKVLLNKGSKGVIKKEGEGDFSIPIPLFFKEELGEISYTYDKNGNLTKKVELDDDG
ncbi:MAG: hypothetical protein AABZ11_04695, partial [Nitrospinota bacterium]